MQETNNVTSDEMLNTSSLNDKPIVDIKMSYPRKPLLDWFLVFSTFGLYASFWLYRRVKEIKPLLKSNVKPWLWVFVPFFAIVQYFAFRNLDRALIEIEGRETEPSIQSIYQVGVAGFIITTAYFSFTSKWATPIWLEFVMYLLVTFSFCAISYRVNTFKSRLTDVEFTGKKKGYNFLEWVIVLIMAPSVTAIFAFVIIYPLMVEKLDTFPDKSVFVQEGHDFKLTFYGDDWHQVELGTNSNGNALAEFESADFDSYFMIFESKNFNANDVNKHVHWRREWFEDQIGQYNCDEKRHFLGDNFTVKIEMVCTEKALRPDSAGFVALLHTQDKTYELLGILSQPRLTFEKKKPQFEAMLREFTLR